MTLTSRLDAFRNSFAELLTKNLSRRAVTYFVYALLTWLITSVLSAKTFTNPPSVRTTVVCAFVCVMGGVLSFVLLAVCRRLFFWGVPEYAVASFGRTGVPSLLLLVCLVKMDESCFRATTLVVLTAYVLTAPLHVWLTIPPESDFQEGYSRSFDRRRD